MLHVEQASTPLGVHDIEEKRGKISEVSLKNALYRGYNIPHYRTEKMIDSAIENGLLRRLRKGILETTTKTT